MPEVHHRPSGGKGSDPSIARRALRRFVKAARALDEAWHPVLEVPTYPRYLPSFDKLVGELSDWIERSHDEFADRERGEEAEFVRSGIERVPERFEHMAA